MYIACRCVYILVYSRVVLNSILSSAAFNRVFSTCSQPLKTQKPTWHQGLFRETDCRKTYVPKPLSVISLQERIILFAETKGEKLLSLVQTPRRLSNATGTKWTIRRYSKSDKTLNRSSLRMHSPSPPPLSLSLSLSISIRFHRVVTILAIFSLFNHFNRSLLIPEHRGYHTTRVPAFFTILLSIL